MLTVLRPPRARSTAVVGRRGLTVVRSGAMAITPSALKRFCARRVERIMGMRRHKAMRLLCVLLLLSIGLVGCAHSRPWSARTLPPCTLATGIPELDRERSYLASLLALDARRYAIVHTVRGREIEATYSTDYPASQ